MPIFVASKAYDSSLQIYVIILFTRSTVNPSKALPNSHYIFCHILHEIKIISFKLSYNHRWNTRYVSPCILHYDSLKNTRLEDTSPMSCILSLSAFLNLPQEDFPEINWAPFYIRVLNNYSPGNNQMLSNSEEFFEENRPLRFSRCSVFAWGKYEPSFRFYHPTRDGRITSFFVYIAIRAPMMTHLQIHC